jgi:hypothetical protein
MMCLQTLPFTADVGVMQVCIAGDNVYMCLVLGENVVFRIFYSLG